MCSHHTDCVPIPGPPLVFITTQQLTWWKHGRKWAIHNSGYSYGMMHITRKIFPMWVELQCCNGWNMSHKWEQAQCFNWHLLLLKPQCSLNPMDESTFFVFLMCKYSSKICFPPTNLTHISSCHWISSAPRWSPKPQPLPSCSDHPFLVEVSKMVRT